MHLNFRFTFKTCLRSWNQTKNRLTLYRRPCCSACPGGRELRTQMRTVQQGCIPIPWSLPIECHQGLVEFAHCRSDLFSASSVSRRARNVLLPLGCLFDSGNGWHRARLHGLVTHMPRVKRLAPRQHRPQDAGVLVGERHHRPFFSCRQPKRSRRASAHCEIGSLRRCAVITADFAPWMSRVRK